jgi:L-seryl-tRNA(Ser) seleniumtransferase
MAATGESVVHGSKARPQDLPSVDKLLRLEAAQALAAAHGHTLVAAQARSLLDHLRVLALAGGLDAGSILPEVLAHELAARVQARLAPRLRRVLNLTGTVIHTNLGRSVLPQAAIAHLTAMMEGPNNLEYDLAGGGRGDRDSIVEGLLCEITGAEAATVVNNNAAAVLLTIAALAGGREVVISRGELVEIGGAFRMPDVMASAGAAMVEVGTTNRTHLADYARAITPRTALLMKVHTSNYAVEGFTASVPEAQLAVRSPKSAASPWPPTWAAVPSSTCPCTACPGNPRRRRCWRRLRRRHLLGRQAAGRPAGRPHRRQPRAGRQDTQVPHEARAAPVQAAAGRARSHAHALPAARAAHARAAHAALAHAPGRAGRADRAAAARTLARRARTALCGDAGSDAEPDRLGLAARRQAALGRPGHRAAAARQARHGHRARSLATALRELPLPIIGRIADDRLLLDCRCLDDAADVLNQMSALRERSRMRPP